MTLQLYWVHSYTEGVILAFSFSLLMLPSQVNFFIKLFGNVLEYKEENTNHCNVVSTLIPHPQFTETSFNKFINELQVDKSN